MSQICLELHAFARTGHVHPCLYDIVLSSQKLAGKHAGRHRGSRTTMMCDNQAKSLQKSTQEGIKYHATKCTLLSLQAVRIPARLTNSLIKLLSTSLPVTDLKHLKVGDSIL
eukprot:scaffold110303_cov21-Tisochrysis_lutea.AAC.1